MGLTVALDNDGKAEGQLFWDDGQSIGEYEPPESLHVIQSNFVREAQHVLVGPKPHLCAGCCQKVNGVWGAPETLLAHIYSTGNCCSYWFPSLASS